VYFWWATLVILQRPRMKWCFCWINANFNQLLMPVIQSRRSTWKCWGSSLRFWPLRRHTLYKLHKRTVLYFIMLLANCVDATLAGHRNLYALSLPIWQYPVGTLWQKRWNCDSKRCKCDKVGVICLVLPRELGLRVFISRVHKLGQNYYGFY
jgi:hypothetical protein